MKKQFFFLNGLPRAGNTLLSVLLNQNPKIRVTTNSLLPDIVCLLDNLKNTTLFKNFPLHKNLDNVIKNSFDNFYSNWDCDYVIDRGPWGTIPNMNILKKIFNKDIRIIILRRPFLEVLASYVKAVKPDDIDSYVDNLFNNKSGVLRANAFIFNNMNNQKNIKFHIVEYNNLVNDTKNTIDKIYNFLDIPKFQHNFNTLNQYNIDGNFYNDSIFGDDIDFHTIRTNKIEKENYHYKEVLSQSIIDKYKDIDKELYNIK